MKFPRIIACGPWAAFAAFALLPACAVGPRYSNPHADVPAQWHEPLANPQSAGTGRWWMTFNDARLCSLIDRAVSANLDARTAALRIEQSRARRDMAASARWPQFSANASFARERLSENTPTGALIDAAGNAGAASPFAGVSVANPYDQYQLGFDLSWEIDLFGRVRRSVEAANADVQASIEESRDVQVSLLGNIGRTYMDLRGAQARLAITGEALTTQKDLLLLTEQRRSAGLSNDLDVENAAALAAATAAAMPLLESQITRDINELSKLLGHTPGALRDELLSAAPVPRPAAAVPLGLPAELTRRRPDIRRAEAQLHAATAREGVAIADLFPRLSIGVSAGLQAQNAADLDAWASRFLSAGPRLEVPIFSAGRRKAAIRLQNAYAREAAVTYARTVLASLHEVENTLAIYASERARQESLESAVRHSRDSLELARARYQSGVANFIDVLDAERTVQTNELTLAESTTALSTAVVMLYKALGGGWETAS